MRLRRTPILARTGGQPPPHCGGEGGIGLPVPPKGGAGNPYLGGTTSPLEGFQSYTFLVLHSLA